MTRDRCKLYTGHGQSVLSKHCRSSPPLTFLSLPIEIRDQIYDLVVVSGSEIIVWKGYRKEEWLSDPSENIEQQDLKDSMWPERHSLYTRIRWRYVDEEATRKSLGTLTTAVFRCNKTVGQEAAYIFYARNIFSFEGRHNYDLIVAWLQGIGPTNLKFLTSIKIDAAYPDPAWQRSSGERKGDHFEKTQELIYPRHPFLQLRPDARYGRVNNINPAVETLFIILSKRPTDAHFDLIMQLPRACYPGVRTHRDDQDIAPESDYYSMDLPNLIERFRTLHTRNVAVRWEGQECRRELEDQQERLESLGWCVDILPTSQDIPDIHPPDWPDIDYHYCHSGTDAISWAKFVLKRKELTGTLWADDPYPFNHIDAENLAKWD